MKNLLFGLVVLLCSPSLYANPFSAVKNFVTHHKRFLLIEGAAVGASVVEYKGMEHCRQGDTEYCYSHKRFLVDAGLSTVALPTAAELYWKKFPDSKIGYAIGYAVPVYQVGQGIYQFKQKSESTKKSCHFDKDDNEFKCEKD